MSKEKKSRILILLLLSLAVVSLMLFSTASDSSVRIAISPLSAISAPFEKFFSNLGSGVSHFFGALAENAKLRSENEQLREENLGLRLEIRDQSQAAMAYEELKTAFSLKDRYPHRRFLAANVLQEPLNENFATYRLDVGQRDGLKFEKETAYAVVDENARLLGRVISADMTCSRLLPLSHEGFSCSVRGEKDSEHSFILRGEGEGKVKVLDIPPETSLAEGDEILTSGRGGVFPENVFCGKVNHISQPDAQGLREAEILPESDMAKRRIVFVLLSPTDKEVSPTGESGEPSKTGEARQP